MNKEQVKQYPSQLRDALVNLLGIVDRIESEEPQRALRFSVGESYEFRGAVLRMAKVLIANQAESKASVAAQLEAKGDSAAPWWSRQSELLRQGLAILDEADAFSG